MKLRLLIRGLAFLAGLIIALTSSAQSFELFKKDTINRTDSAGVKQGKWMFFNKDNKNPDYPENALLEELTYKNGLREGVRKLYFSNGKLKSEVNYLNNRPAGMARFYYPNGTIAEEGNWVYGGWEGNYKNYYETGPLSQDLSYSYGKKEGVQKQYHSNGQLKSEGVWKDGVPDGAVKEYNEDGALVSETVYNKGVVNEQQTRYFEVPKADEEKNISTNASGSSKTSNNQAAAGENVGSFTGNGYYKVKNKQGLVAREGIFSNGLLVDGKQFFYNADGELTKTVVYKDGKVSQEILENK